MKTKELEGILKRYAIEERIFARVNLRGIDLAGKNLENLVLSQVDLTGSNLQGANLSQADLTGAILIDSNLQGAKLSGSQLQSAMLCRANLTQANLREANLRAADLTEAVMVDADLQGVNFLEAYLLRTNLRGVNLHDAKFLTTALWDANLIQEYQLLWWLEIKTAKPYCTYWFGPFASPQEARLYQAGYVEDLVEEQAEGITIKLQLQQNQPKTLTICSDSELD